MSRRAFCGACCLLWISACSVTSRATVFVDAGHLVEPATAELVTDPSAEALLMQLPEGSTVSELALVSAEDGKLCFDALLRVWPGGTSSFDVVVNVDGWNATERRWQLQSCAGGTCLPDDSPLVRRPFDGFFRSIRVLGGRQCIDAPFPKHRVELFLGENGSMSIEVDFDVVAMVR